MSAWTATDRDAVRAAILALAKGERTATVAFADRTVTYQPADLATLRETLAMIEADIAAAASTPRPKQYLGSSSTGL